MNSHPAHKEVTFAALSGKRTFKEIERQIREMIFSGALKPGDKLPSEHKLASQFKVARLSVREALRALEQAGLIIVKQGNTGGSYIKEPDLRVTAESMSDLMRRSNLTLRHLTDARLAIEKLVLDKVMANISDEHLRTLEARVQELEDLSKEEEQGGYPVDPILTSFHITLAQISGNPVFEIIVRVLIEVTAISLKPTNIDSERLREHGLLHRAVYEALKDGDRSRCQRAFEEHMLRTESLLAGELTTKRKKGREQKLWQIRKSP